MTVSAPRVGSQGRVSLGRVGFGLGVGWGLLAEGRMDGRMGLG